MRPYDETLLPKTNFDTRPRCRVAIFCVLSTTSVDAARMNHTAVAFDSATAREERARAAHRRTISNSHRRTGKSAQRRRLRRILRTTAAPWALVRESKYVQQRGLMSMKVRWAISGRFHDPAAAWVISREYMSIRPVFGGGQLALSRRWS